MKITNLFAGLLLSTILGVGVSTAVTTKENVDSVEEIRAADTSATLYINQFDGGGSWANFTYYLYGTGGNNGWPGESFTDSMKTPTPNEYDQYQYKLTINTTSYQYLILVGNPSGWGGSQAQTEDLKISDMSANGIYCGSQISGTNKFSVGYYPYITKTVYLHDLKGDVYNTKHYCHTFATGHSGTTWPGVAMTKVAGSNNVYSAEINANLDNVMFNNNGSNQTDTIPDVVDGDTFIVYPDNGYNKTTLNATSFIDKYMKFETAWLDNSGTGLCKSAGWYSSAKLAFESLLPAVKTEVLKHEPTSYRLEAWAKANSETFSRSSGTFSKASTTPIISLTNNDNSLMITIVAITSVVSLTAIGGYFFFRKRKVN